MVRKDFDAYEHFKCAAAIPHNPNLEEDIKSIRAKYGLDKLTHSQSWDWYHRQFVMSQRVKSTYLLLVVPDKVRREAASASMKHPFDTRISIEKDIGILMYRYRLPLIAFKDILAYILRGSLKGMHPTHPMGYRAWLRRYEPSLEDIVDVLPTGCCTITIANLNQWTTKKQWEAIWDAQVLPLRNKLREFLAIKRVPRKRATQASLDEEMRRYSEWYQLSEIQGLGPKKALEMWEQDYSEQSGDFDQSTVAHAIKEFRAIITPMPVEG